jgi:hypothetical protein
MKIPVPGSNRVDSSQVILMYAIPIRRQNFNIWFYQHPVEWHIFELMKKAFSIFLLLTLVTCEMQGFISFIADQRECCMMTECSTEKKNECESSDKIPACCRTCCVFCVYILPEKISVSIEETVRQKLFVFNERIFSFYVFDTFHPPELYI